MTYTYPHLRSPLLFLHSTRFFVSTPPAPNLKRTSRPVNASSVSARVKLSRSAVELSQFHTCIFVFHFHFQFLHSHPCAINQPLIRPAPATGIPPSRKLAITNLFPKPRTSRSITTRPRIHLTIHAAARSSRPICTASTTTFSDRRLCLKHYCS